MKALEIITGHVIYNPLIPTNSNWKPPKRPYKIGYLSMSSSGSEGFIVCVQLEADFFGLKTFLEMSLNFCRSRIS